MNVDRRAMSNELLRGWTQCIAGGLYGTTQDMFKTQGIGNSPDVAIPMSELVSLSAKNALTLRSTAAAEGWSIAPADTKLLRIATAVLSDEAGWHSATTGFADARTKKTLMLVYFNQPCRLSGTVVTRLAGGVSQSTVVDVVIEKAGLNWLEITESGDANTEIRRAPVSVQPIVTAQSREKMG